MRLILHLVNKDDAILYCRAATSILKDKLKPGAVRLVQFESGKTFEVRRNKQSISVWSVPDYPNFEAEK